MTDEYDRHPTVVRKTHESASVAEIVDVILDKGIVIDAWVRVSIIGLEILTIEARVVVASVETYLRYAEAIGLTALASRPRTEHNGQQSQRRLPLEDEILGYLSEHSDRMR